MKLSLKLQEDQPQNPLIKAKIPISIFNQPFISSISTTSSTLITTTNSSSSHLCFSLSSKFSSGPAFRFSYSPTTLTSSNPFSLSLKSGLGLFGSPINSPLVFTAQFSFSTSNPTFSLQFKPQFGNFFLQKTTVSNPHSYQSSGSHSNFSVGLDSGSHSNGEFGDGITSPESSVWQEVKLEPLSGRDRLASNDRKENFGIHSNDGIGNGGERLLGLKTRGTDGFWSGVAVMARTALPLTKRMMVDMRWGVNFPANLGINLPYLTVNKIGIERVHEAIEEKKLTADNNVGDLELLKGMCFLMRSDLELLEEENKDLKKCLEQIKLEFSSKRFHGKSETGGKKSVMNPSESSNEFESWRNNKSVKEENGRRETKKSSNQVNDVESELQKAIKAASS